MSDDAVRFNPRLPDEVTELRFQFRFRSQRIDTTITHYLLELHTRPVDGVAMPIAIRAADQVIELQPHQSMSIDLRPRAGSRA